MTETTLPAISPAPGPTAPPPAAPPAPRRRPGRPRGSTAPAAPLASAPPASRPRRSRRPRTLDLSGFPLWFAALQPVLASLTIGWGELDRLFRVLSVLREHQEAQRGGTPSDAILGHLEALQGQMADTAGILSQFHEALIGIRQALQGAGVVPSAQGALAAVRTEREAGDGYRPARDPQAPVRQVRVLEVDGKPTILTIHPTALDMRQVAKVAGVLKQRYRPGIVDAAVQELQEQAAKGAPLSRPVPQWLMDKCEAIKERMEERGDVEFVDEEMAPDPDDGSGDDPEDLLADGPPSGAQPVADLDALLAAADGGEE